MLAGQGRAPIKITNCDQPNPRCSGGTNPILLFANPTLGVMVEPILFSTGLLLFATQMSSYENSQVASVLKCLEKIVPVGNLWLNLSHWHNRKETFSSATLLSRRRASPCCNLGAVHADNREFYLCSLAVTGNNRGL